jgi:predicted nucleotidyltransferase
MDSHIQSALDELRRGFEETYGQRLTRLVLYGSQARGDAAPGADLDILVLLRGAVDACEEIERCGKMTADLSLKHDIVVSCVFMAEEDFDRRQGPFLRNVRREGVAV